MKTVAVISRKGGAGKTTVAVNLAVSAFRAGRKTMLADIDPQRSSFDALRARTIDGPALAGISAGKLFHTKSQAAHDGFELLVVDTPAAPDSDVVQAVNSADLCLLVCRPTFLDIASVARSAEFVRSLGKPGLIILNQAPPKRGGLEPVTVQKAVQALRFCSLPVASVGLRARAAYQQSIAHGRSVGEWDANSAGAIEIARLWENVAAMLAFDNKDQNAKVG